MSDSYEVQQNHTGKAGIQYRYAACQIINTSKKDGSDV